MARYAWMPERGLAVMEMSETAGLARLAPDERDPSRANTCGVGEMLIDAAQRGAREIIVGLGGSATNDGGFGMARALGFRFYADQRELTNGPAELVSLTRTVRDGASFRLPRVIGVADVRNPLLGARGATRTFGPQKGAAPDHLEVLENALARFADVVARDLGCDFRENDGAGAAGGLGFGLLSFCGGTVHPGFDLVAEKVDLGAAIRRAEVVITGEGRLDEQTLEGKAPAGVAQRARALGKHVYAIVGCATGNSEVLGVFDGVYALVTSKIAKEEAMSRTKELLRERARELGRALLPSCS
jgi:glycerate kinase